MITSNKRYVLVATFAVLLICGLFLLLATAQPQESTVTVHESQENLLGLGDIESVYIHSGLDITCPQIQGVAQHGYVYTVQLTQQRGIVERIGCGVGSPEIYAQAIAQDLQTQGFAQIDSSLLLERMTFKFYDLNTSNN